MKSLRFVAAAVALLSFGHAPAGAGETPVNPTVAKIVSEVDEARMKAIIAKLVSFGTRNTMSSQDDPVRGIGAARQWIFNEFKSYSPRLEVSFDKYRVKKQGQRIFKDVDLWNVMAVLPGKKSPETRIIIGAHYDSLNLGTRPATQPAGPGAAAQLTPADYERNAGYDAPGACDDGSSVSAVMELARVMSQYEFDKTLVFVAFAGEEQGLVGSTLLAGRLKKENVEIEAVLNNDIIGTEVAGNGRASNNSVSVFTDETMDSISQQLGRYVHDTAARYIPGFRVDNIYMQDRLGRGGDHTPFQLEGYAAVRISTPNEIYANQHRATDLLENMSVPYTAKVARVNGAVAASLALSPKAPLVMRAAPVGNRAGTGAPGGRRPTPMITRGGGYDAVLQWRSAGSEADIKGYSILIRATTATNWEREIYVGKITTYTFKDFSVDDSKFGVKVIGLDGSESLVTAYAYPPRTRTEIETLP